MNLLLDTHILLWVLSGDRRLPKKAAELIEDENNTIYYSVISMWEVEIKHIMHPNELTVTSHELAEYCEQSGFLTLPLEQKDIDVLHLLHYKLPEGVSEGIHKDPFDRILICQAKANGFMFMTHDSRLPGYGESCIISL